MKREALQRQAHTVLIADSAFYGLSADEVSSALGLSVGAEKLALEDLVQQGLAFNTTSHERYAAL